MKKNIGITDKGIRLLIAIILAVLVITNVVIGTWAIVALIAAVLLLSTSLINFCPLYALFGKSTCKVK